VTTESTYYAYILSSHKGTLYTGMTRDISTRIDQHKVGHGSQFTAKYQITTLVYCELIESLDSAREREAQIKRWNRKKKIHLIEFENPYWHDISESVG
jgi:putative endonuclease